MTGKKSIEPLLGRRFQQALVYAAGLHARQVKKGSGVPYVAHLLGVAALVLEAGGDEDLAIAALLHDAIEDQGHQVDLARIRKRFGARVAHVVEGCTDADTVPKPPWRPRKERYIEHIRQQADADTLLVSAADKLYNARAILTDFRELGDAVFARFKGGKQGTLWYYRELVQAFRERGKPRRLTDELERVVNELERLAGAPAPD